MIRRFLLKVLNYTKGRSDKVYSVLNRRLTKNMVEYKLPQRQIHRWNILTKDEALKFLSDTVCKIMTGSDKSVIVIGQPSELFRKELERNRVTYEVVSHQALLETLDSKDNVGCIVSLYFDSKINFEIANEILANERFRNVPFEYIGDAFAEYEVLKSYDRYKSTTFISPILHLEHNVFDIYKESLTKFDLKCDVRDYMDIVQFILHVKKNSIAGDIAEFGSFKGHSGYLIASLVSKYALQKRVYLFDMFENFPQEEIGIDAFWSKTHLVNFEEVKSKFVDVKNVELIKGDFTITYKSAGIKTLSFIHVDCDSFRATKYLMEELFDEVLSVGGLMVFEDYGHPGLLGNRVAVESYFKEKENCFTFFSQFSGYYIVYKTS